MTIDEAIKRYTSNAEYERTHGNLQGCLEFRQLAEWLKDYKRLLEQQSMPTMYYPQVEGITPIVVLDKQVSVLPQNDKSRADEITNCVAMVVNKPLVTQRSCNDCIGRQAVLSYIYNDLRLGDEENGADIERQKELESSYKYVKSLPPVTPQEPSITWVTGADGAKIAFKDVPVWKVTKICEILGEPQEGANEYENNN